MEIIEKARREGDKTVGAERVRTKTKKGINEMLKV